MSVFRAHPLPLFLVVIRRKEDISWTRLGGWKTNTTPSLAQPSHFPRQEVGGLAPWAPPSLGCQVSSEYCRAEGWVAAMAGPHPQLGPHPHPLQHL